MVVAVMAKKAPRVQHVEPCDPFGEDGDDEDNDAPVQGHHELERFLRVESFREVANVLAVAEFMMRGLKDQPRSHHHTGNVVAHEGDKDCHRRELKFPGNPTDAVAAPVVDVEVFLVV